MRSARIQRERSRLRRSPRYDDVVMNAACGEMVSGNRRHGVFVTERRHARTAMSERLPVGE